MYSNCKIFFQNAKETAFNHTLLFSLRDALPTKIISYTAPGLVPPFREVLFFAHEKMDSITMYSASSTPSDDYVTELESFGIPRNKIVWGIPIGCNPTRFNPDLEVTLDEAINVVNKVKNGGYAGVVTWSINRDTDHRTDAGPGCTAYQTGQPDGTFINEIGKALK